MLVRVRRAKELKIILESPYTDKKIKDRLSNKEWSGKLVSQQLSHLFN